jgi:hypothetical protein
MLWKIKKRIAYIAMGHNILWPIILYKTDLGGKKLASYAIQRPLEKFTSLESSTMHV